jgi:nucleoside-diphosphate-sugar epimerase
MKILVTGGTGFIGTHVVRELLSLDPEISIRILTRRAQTANRWGKRVEFTQANVTKPATLASSAAGVDVAVHAVQFPNHPMENPALGWTFLEVNGKGTRNMVEACKTARVRRFIYMSCARGACAKDRPWVTARKMAENAVRESGIEYVILRPSFVYGPEDRSLNRIIGFTRHLPFVPVIGDGKATLRPVSVFDVARVAALAALKQGGVNQTYGLGGPQELTIDQVARTVQKVLGKKRVLVHIPVALAQFIAGLLSMLPAPPLSSSAVDFMLVEEKVDPGAAEQAFDMRFEDLETALRYLD